MGEDDVRDCKEIPMENKEWLDILEKEPYYAATHAAPFSELFSVAVHRDYFGQRDTIQIYGTIIIYDEDQNITPYDLYTRDSDDPETLTPQHNLLSLDMPVECLASTTWLRMYLNLKDKVDGALILEEDFYFDKLTDINQYNKVQQITLNNSVVVTYAAFSAAVVAVLDITLIKPKDTAPVPLNLHGKITARCGNTYGHKYPGIVLLTTPSYQPIQANVPILLSRDVVVVPAYSFLRIDVHLSQPHQQDITCQADFLAINLYANECDIVANDDFVVHFNVQWCHPLQLLLKAKRPIECPKICTDVRVHDVGRRPRSLLEVYTVMVHHDTNRELKIYGKMSVRDNWTGFSLFNRKELNPVILSGNVETIPIYVKRCLNVSEYLVMELKLKDVEGRVLIEGQIYWDDYEVQKPICWYHTPMCSVIPGVHGYAAVFYSIFSEARQAEVRISFEWDGYPDARYSVDGSVVARHSKGIYLTVHDKAYYQSVLFRGNSSDLQSGCTVPLSKSVVAVPIDAFLTVGIDLDASPLSCELPKEHLTWDVTFNMVPDFKQIKGKGKCIIKVSVEWSDFRKIFSEEKESDSE